MNWINIYQQMKKLILTFTTLLLIGFGLAHFAMPLWLDFSVAIILLYSIRIPLHAFIFTLFCMALSFSTSWVWGDYRIEEIYYRDHEKHLDDNGLYTPNVFDELSMPYGDLYAIGKIAPSQQLEEIKEPRSVIFKTDSHGFRNDVNLKDAEIILSGDSFIVANGTTQHEIPSVRLGEILGKKVGNVAYPGNPDLYEQHLIKYSLEVRKDASVYVFYFEGNDFFMKSNEPVESQTNNVGRQWLQHTALEKVYDLYYKFEDKKDGYLNFIYPKNQVFFRLIRRASHTINKHMISFVERFLANNDGPKSLPVLNPVLIKKINGYEVAFYKRNNQVSQSLSLETYVFQDVSLLKRVKGVFFIPTKFRVYSELLKENVSNVAFGLLKDSYEPKEIPVYDLTPILQREASIAASKGEFVFWKDDTHWNGRGISVSMAYVAEQIKATATQR